jgi:hypothetical protein
MDLEPAKAATRTAMANANSAVVVASSEYERDLATAIQLLATSLLELETALGNEGSNG